MEETIKKPVHPGRLHEWVSTASPVVDRCRLCGLTRRLQQGKWIEPETSKPKTVTPQAEQIGLWR